MPNCRKANNEVSAVRLGDRRGCLEVDCEKWGWILIQLGKIGWFLAVCDGFTLLKSQNTID